MFDQPAFAAGLERLGVRVTTAAPPVEHTIHLGLEGVPMDALRSISLLNSQKHLRHRWHACHMAGRGLWPSLAWHVVWRAPVAGCERADCSPATWSAYPRCRLDCPALRVEAQLMARNEALVFATLQALQPARPLRDIVDRCNIGGQSAFSAAWRLLPLIIQQAAEDAAGACLPSSQPLVALNLAC